MLFIPHLHLYQFCINDFFYGELLEDVYSEYSIKNIYYYI